MSIDESNFKGWRMLMVAFLIIGGGLSNYLIEGDIGARIYEYRSIGYLVFGGLLIGFGTRMGSGCTSGHGVCGISRLSPRSIVATVTFMFAGAAAVYFIKTFLGA
ncbi:MAG: YeeE/YedE family protein [Bdellovibrionales bacterium]|nr:YeeE/YedE family protein [Bdellovibrionales bacterium]